METTKKSTVVRSLLGTEAVDIEQSQSYAYDGSELSCSISTSLSSSASPPKNPFRFPPPPVFLSYTRSSTDQLCNDNVESDNSLTTGSASDVEDNSDSQSDVAGLGCLRQEESRGSQYRPCLKKESGSLSDTGFGGVSGSSNLKMRSSPVPIHRPVHSLRGYESDGSPIGFRSQANFLPPIGVFWDIENCAVPKGKSAIAVAQFIREKFFEGRREAEFLVVCDVKKENAQVISELNDAQVNLIHVSATCKNAADEKLRQAIRRFAEIYGSPAAIILISGDVNFAADLNDLRHRKKIHVILLHNSCTSQTLILCANEHYNFNSLVENLPYRETFQSSNQPVEVIVSNLPQVKDYGRVKHRLSKLSDNCGGRVGRIVNDIAVIRFPSIEYGYRAQRRMDGQDVLGNKIFVSKPQKVSDKDQESPFKFSADRPRVRRNTHRSGDDIKISNLPHPLDPTGNQYLVNSSLQVRNRGMYFPKGYGGNSKSDTPPISLASASLASTSLASSSLAPGSLTSGTLPPFSISQTGIGTPNFYRTTPPPRIVLGNVHAGVSGASQTVNHSVLNGWNSVNVCGSMSSGSSQPLAGETFPTMYAKAARSVQPPKQFQLSQQIWQGAPSSSAKPTSPSLQMASQSLSLLAANLPNSGTGDFTPDLWKHMSEMHKPQVDSSFLWEDRSSSLQTSNVSPLRGSTAPHARSPSPSALASASAQAHSMSGLSRAGAGDGVQWSNQVRSSGGVGTVAKSRTPSPYNLSVDQLYQPQVNRRSWGHTSKTSPVMDVKDNDRFFHSISSSQARQTSQGSNGPVELQVTNLDQNMDAKELKRILQAVFREHVLVLHISVFVQSDGNFAATVRVPSLQDAQYAISQLHRKKVGFKRIQISYSQSGPTMNPALVRSQIVSLLQDVPGHRLPLFKFREMFENRYLSSISVSDMYKLRDVCLVSEEPNGRMVTLNPQHRNTPSPLMAGGNQDGQSSMELPYCTQHYQKPNIQDKGWAEQELATLPNVSIGLTEFTQRVHGLLQSHSGSMPLPSFAHCYNAQFGPLEIDDNGVPLEHLVSCVSGVELYQGVGCVKYLRWASGADNDAANDTDGSSVVSNVSPPLAGPLALFSRELVDLLKTAPNCQISFNRFIPAYHHHFGRQCRVADYGYTKLMPLLEALPNIVQVLGEGNKRMVTLSHRAQIRRFTSDLLRVLKAQYSKQVTLSEFPTAYQRVLNRPFEVVNYGVCKVEDLLAEVAETTVLVSPIPNCDDVLIAIPKREQTQEEMERTKQFASEVLQLLRYAPQCTMDFSKFIPYYHHHFGKQCRVSDYGFSKLIELFEAIPDVVKVSEGEEGERRVQLTLEQRLHVLGDIVATLVKEYGHSYMPILSVSENFLLTSGYALRPEDYGFVSLEDLFCAIHFSVKIHVTPSGTFVGLVDQDHLHSIRLSVRNILWAVEECRMSASDFCDSFSTIIGGKCNFNDMERDLKDIIEVVRDADGEVQCICLKPLQVFARSVYQLLQECDGQLPLSTFETCYIQRFGKAVQPAQFGFSSLMALLQSLQDIFGIKGKGQRRFLVLETSAESKCKNLKEDLANSWINNTANITPTKNFIAKDECSKVGESPDTVLKKLIRNLSNQVSPAKLRVCGDRASGGAQGYRPLGFATSQQPLHLDSSQHFSWGPPHLSHDGYSSFTLPLAIPPCPLGSPPSLLNGVNGAQLASPSSSRASLPVVQPPHPSELPMPRLALTSPTFPSNADYLSGTSVCVEGSALENHVPNSMDSEGHIHDTSFVEEPLESAQCGILNSSQDGSQSAGRSKRKQRLAIQFTSPLVPI